MAPAKKNKPDKSKAKSEATEDTNPPATAKKAHTAYNPRMRAYVVMQDSASKIRNKSASRADAPASDPPVPATKAARPQKADRSKAKSTAGGAKGAEAGGKRPHAKDSAPRSHLPVKATGAAVKSTTPASFSEEDEPEPEPTRRLTRAAAKAGPAAAPPPGEARKDSKAKTGSKAVALPADVPTARQGPALRRSKRPPTPLPVSDADEDEDEDGIEEAGSEEGNFEEGDFEDDAVEEDHFEDDVVEEEDFVNGVVEEDDSDDGEDGEGDRCAEDGDGIKDDDEYEDSDEYGAGVLHATPTPASDEEGLAEHAEEDELSGVEEGGAGTSSDRDLFFDPPFTQKPAQSQLNIKSSFELGATPTMSSQAIASPLPVRETQGSLGEAANWGLGDPYDDVETDTTDSLHPTDRVTLPPDLEDDAAPNELPGPKSRVIFQVGHKFDFLLAPELRMYRERGHILKIPTSESKRPIDKYVCWWNPAKKVPEAIPDGYYVPEARKYEDKLFIFKYDRAVAKVYAQQIRTAYRILDVPDHRDPAPRGISSKSLPQYYAAVEAKKVRQAAEQADKEAERKAERAAERAAERVSEEAKQAALEAEAVEDLRKSSKDLKAMGRKEADKERRRKKEGERLRKGASIDWDEEEEVEMSSEPAKKGKAKQAKKRQLESSGDESSVAAAGHTDSGATKAPEAKRRRRDQNETLNLPAEDEGGSRKSGGARGKRVWTAELRAKLSTATQLIAELAEKTDSDIYTVLAKGCMAVRFAREESAWVVFEKLCKEEGGNAKAAAADMTFSQYAGQEYQKFKKQYKHDKEKWEELVQSWRDGLIKNPHIDADEEPDAGVAAHNSRELAKFVDKLGDQHRKLAMSSASMAPIDIITIIGSPDPVIAQCNTVITSNANVEIMLRSNPAGTKAMIGRMVHLIRSFDLNTMDPKKMSPSDFVAFATGVKIEEEEEDEASKAAAELSAKIHDYRDIAGRWKETGALPMSFGDQKGRDKSRSMVRTMLMSIVVRHHATDGVFAAKAGDKASLSMWKTGILDVCWKEELVFIWEEGVAEMEDSDPGGENFDPGLWTRRSQHDAVLRSIKDEVIMVLPRPEEERTIKVGTADFARIAIVKFSCGKVFKRIGDSPKYLRWLAQNARTIPEILDSRKALTDDCVPVELVDDKKGPSAEFEKISNLNRLLIHAARKPIPMPKKVKPAASKAPSANVAPRAKLTAHPHQSGSHARTSTSRPKPPTLRTRPSKPKFDGDGNDWPLRE
ncbi:hypothetical protein DFP72DRAFT_850708 [Ephemerocybe angulata]|uniref:Uncharacterized protein n=1 Tax=Ephemerocybe angulata TaxID=980116 RepID=A0A8H6M4X2_9AGAR|nr:hypothetical protein DFP72DRAFT_850708 [Tulosesus angulatus]